VLLAVTVLFWICQGPANIAHAQRVSRVIFPEQRDIVVRPTNAFGVRRLPELPTPPTVQRNFNKIPIRRLTLDDALRIGLENSEVVRVLAGVTAVSSGRTIYDPAIANAGIDEANARFDPTFSARNTWNRTDTPVAVFDPANPNRALIVPSGADTETYNLNANLSKTNTAGGVLNFGVNTTPTRFQRGVFPLNRQTRSAATLSYTQPLLQGGGWAANLAPVVLARIQTERSFFQFKDSIQELARGIVEAYWAVVFARTDVWAREQQVEQGQEAYNQIYAAFRAGRVSAADVAQSRLALANFRATLITSRANLLQREAALRNILGLPPYGPEWLVPITPPTTRRITFDWNGLYRLAEQQRPDIVELKLILEADEQQITQARNQALPRVDAVMLYRWNGLEGEMPDSSAISTRGGQFTDWSFGVNFSVPLGLRQSRATLRRRSLVLARDRANLDQGLHNASHIIALNLRNLDQFYSQYEAFREVREAALENLKVQIARNVAGQTIFLNVLEAITSWGNAVSSEAQSLAQYNTQLASLERQTGVILETHGVRFYEERYGAIGPMGRLFRPRIYPRGMRPGANTPQYQNSDQPAEEAFDLTPPDFRRRSSSRKKRNTPTPSGNQNGAGSLELLPQPPARP